MLPKIACLRPSMAPSLQPLIQTANMSREEKTRLRKQEPHRWAEIMARKNKHVERQKELKAQRDAEWGHPVHGLPTPTPFVESFDTAGQVEVAPPPVDEEGNPVGEGRPLPTSPHIRNYLLSEEELKGAVEYTEQLMRPKPATDRSAVDPVQEQEAIEEFDKNHQKAIEALKRIVTMDNASAKDRKHANIRRCIETFGRHVTDHTVPNARPLPGVDSVPVPKPERAGPDTGSSEVQIAILTAKIRALAKALEGPGGNRDKNNKRSLALLCHKRQRLLRYMERKERGSGRWEHMIKTLGITPAMWKEQITLP